MPLPPPSKLHARPSHSSRFYHLHNSGWGIQIVGHLIMTFSPHTCHFMYLQRKIKHMLLKSRKPTQSVNSWI
jgi:hypothetical protein